MRTVPARTTTIRHLVAAAALGVALLAPAGCIELTGQRIVWRYDRPSDRLTALITYDGIHHSEKGSLRDAEQALRTFVGERHVMLFDWFLRVRLERLAADAESARTPPALRAFLHQLLDSIDVEVVGHYFDAQDRIGAVQRVAFDGVTPLLTAANAAIDEAVLAIDPAAAEGRWDTMLARWRATAAHGHRWLELDGNAIAFRFPIEPLGWARLKLALFDELERLGALAAGSDRGPTGGGDALRLVRRLAATATVSLTQTADEAVFRFGDPERPVPLRVQWRDEYQPNVEKLVEELAPVELDAALAAALLGAAPEPGPLAELAAWGPPEDRVRAVVRAAGGSDDAGRMRALQWLRAFGEAWNEELRAPPAPPPGDADEVYLAGWQHWCRTLLLEPQPR